MENIAGRSDSDDIVFPELQRAGIVAYRGVVKPYGEGKTTVFGVLGGEEMTQEHVDMFTEMPVDSPSVWAESFSFLFTRAWYYWVVGGYVPLDIAKRIYRHPDCVKDVRVAGHCGAPPPEEWVKRCKIAGRYCVDSYHIDTQAGLNAFVSIVKAEGLV